MEKGAAVASRRPQRFLPRRRVLNRPTIVAGGGPLPDEIALLERMYREFQGPAFALAWRLLGDRQLAEDAIHQAFVQILSTVVFGDPHTLERDLRTMVLRNTRWAAIRIQQKKRIRAEAEQQFGRENLNPGIEDWVQAEARILCEDVLGRLPRAYIEVLRARYVNQYPDHVAAERLGVGVTAYRSRLRRALGAARRSARGSGLRPGWVGGLALPAWWRLPRRHAHGALTARPPRPLLSPGRLAYPAALSIVVGGVVLQGPSGAGRAAVPPSAPVRAAPAAVAGESADDVLVYSAQARAGTIVAVGLGNRCACEVVMQTTDGGTTWHLAPGPAAATTVALPPDYPRDPRIFVAGASMDVVAAHFGAPFRALPVPAGPLALDPGFDRGHPFAFVAADDGVWRLDVRAGTARWLASAGSAGDLRAVGSGLDGDVFVLSTHGHDGSTLLRCTSSVDACTAVSRSLPAMDRLIVAPDYATSHMLALYRSTGTILLSRDGGHTFARVAPPSGSIASLVFASGHGPVLWAIADRSGRGQIVGLLGLNGSWGSLGSGADDVPEGGSLVSLAGDHVLDLLPGHGLVCAGRDGIRWMRCGG